MEVEGVMLEEEERSMTSGARCGGKEARRPGGEGCIGRVEGLGGVQANIPSPGLMPETMLEQEEGAGVGGGVDGGEGGQRGGVDVVGAQAQEECGQGQTRAGGEVVERWWGV